MSNRKKNKIKKGIKENKKLMIKNHLLNKVHNKENLKRKLD